MSWEGGKGLVRASRGAESLRGQPRRTFRSCWNEALGLITAQATPSKGGPQSGQAGRLTPNYPNSSGGG